MMRAELLRESNGFSEEADEPGNKKRTGAEERVGGLPGKRLSRDTF